MSIWRLNVPIYLDLQINVKYGIQKVPLGISCITIANKSVIYNKLKDNLFTINFVSLQKASSFMFSLI